MALGMGGCEWCLAARRVNMPMVDDTERVSPGHDDKGAIGDHDIVHVWGNWRACLTTVQQARLTVMRGHVLDASHVPGTRYEGDTDKLYETDSGLLVPVVAWPDEA